MNEQLTTDPLVDCIQPDGSLYHLGWYLSWNPENDTATLDGEFSANDLRAIADHMEKHAK